VATRRPSWLIDRNRRRPYLIGVVSVSKTRILKQLLQNDQDVFVAVSDENLLALRPSQNPVQVCCQERTPSLLLPPYPIDAKELQRTDNKATDPLGV
jgi:anti-sigma-K factor RskA